jgi:hypothetical protein
MLIETYELPEVTAHDLSGNQTNCGGLSKVTESW